MELQPIVGTACAHCGARILVDADGKNCNGCGLALHRRCGKAHRGECAQRPMVATAAHDYGEVAPLRVTPQLVAMFSIGAFLLALGLRVVAEPSPEPPPGETAAARSDKRAPWGWLAAGLGVAALVGGYVVERGRQSAAR